MKQDIIVGILAIICLCGVIILTILRFDTQILTSTLGVLVGYFVGKNRDQIAGYLGGKKLGHKR